MRALVTGANGQLGRAMRIAAAERGLDCIYTDVAGEGVERLDIADPGAVMAMVEERGIDCIVNCAAYTNVEQAEDDYEAAELLNATAVGYLAEAMKAAGGLLVHVSTDYVFGGNQGNTPRTELEPANPTGVYGLTKLHGEEAALATGCRCIIVRTAWLYSEHGKNFVKTMLALTAQKPQLRVVFDQAGTPTYALDLARAIATILATAPEKTGVYHFSNEGVCSWFDFAKVIADYAGHADCDVQPCHSSEFPSKVVRPAYSVLDKTKIKETFGLKIPYWTDSLKLCINNLKNK